MLQRRVVFVDEDAHLLPRLDKRRLDDVQKADSKGGLRTHLNTIFLLISVESVVEIGTHGFGPSTHVAHVEAYDWVGASSNSLIVGLCPPYSAMRYSLGVCPVAFLNALLKYCGYW